LRVSPLGIVTSLDRLSETTSEPLTTEPATIKSPVVPEMAESPFTLAPKTCTIAASSVLRVPLIRERSETTSKAPGRTAIPPLTVPRTHVTPLMTTTLLIVPVRVVAQAGEPPGSTVALK
jgi:hypothetical protein